MAVLHGTNLLYGEYTLILAPVAPALEGPHDMYQVTLLLNDRIVYQKQHSVHGWQEGHYPVRRIAYAFQSAVKLLDAKFDFGLNQAGADEGNWKETAHLFTNAAWLQILLFGTTRLKRRGPLLNVRVFLADEQSDWEGVEHRVSAQFLCSIPEAEEFGKTLAAECDATAQRRTALGLDAEDEETEEENE